MRMSCFTPYCRTLAVLLVTILGLTSTGFGQSDAFWQTGQPLSGEAAQIVFQTLQPGQQTSGSDLLTSVNQVGGSNFASYQRVGPNHRTNIIQEGFGNELVYGVRGQDTDVTLGQFGNGNRISLPDVQLQNAQLTIIQEGNGNGLYQQTGYAGQGVTMEIRQTGGMQLIIQNGPSGF